MRLNPEDQQLVGFMWLGFFLLLMLFWPLLTAALRTWFNW